MSAGNGSSPGLGAGPIEAGARRLLGKTLTGAWSTQMAPRSPVGPGAVKLQLERDAAEVAGDLEGEAWIEAIATRPRHLYLRIATDTLRSWVTAGYESSRPQGKGGTDDSALVRLEGEASQPLTAFRRSAVATALTKILAHPPTAQGTTKTVVVGDRPTRAGEAIHVAVGEVDVRYSALRMRHGGIVGVDDAAAEIVRCLETTAPGRSGLLSDQHILPALAVLLLSTPRAKHIHLDDEKIRQGALALSHVNEALSSSPEPEEKGLPEGNSSEADEAIRRLAFELDALPRHVAFAAAKLDPAYVARFVLSSGALTSAARLETTDPLRDAAGAAIESALELLHLGLDNQPQQL